MPDFDANALQDRDFQFTITGGQVTAMQAVRGSHAHDVHLPAGATFTVGDSTITETLTAPGGATIITYAQEAGSTTLYDVSDITTTFSNPSTVRGGYSFTLMDGSVTGGTHVEIEHGHSRSEPLHSPADAIFTVGTCSITEQYVKGDEVDTITFTQPAGSTLYAVASIEKTFIDPGAATTVLDVAPQNQREFTFDASGNVSQVQRLDAQGGLHSVAANSHVTYTALAPGYVEQVTTYGSQSTYAVYYAGSSGDGTYAQIAHGSGSTVDLAGLQAQVAQAEHLLPTTPYTASGWVI